MVCDNDGAQRNESETSIFQILEPSFKRLECGIARVTDGHGVTSAPS